MLQAYIYVYGLARNSASCVTLKPSEQVSSVVLLYYFAVLGGRLAHVSFVLAVV